MLCDIYVCACVCVSRVLPSCSTIFDCMLDDQLFVLPQCLLDNEQDNNHNNGNWGVTDEGCD